MVCSGSVVGKRWLLGLGGVLLVACSSSAPSPDLTGDATWAAKFGPFTLEAPVVGVGIASDPEGARALANFRLAAGFSVSAPDAAAWLTRVALAHALGGELATAARNQGQVTDAELAQWTEHHWLTVDRPPAFRTTHAIVLVPTGADAAARADARQLAEQIRAAVSSAPSLDEFKVKAGAVPSSGLMVKVEDLDAVAADGRVVRIGTKPGAPVGTYDPAFAQAAAALSSVGETSPVVASAFGYHVLRLTEVVPELRLGVAERRTLAAPDAFDQRARSQLRDLLDAQRSQAVVVVERSAEEATSRVRVE